MQPQIMYTPRLFGSPLRLVIAAVCLAFLGFPVGTGPAPAQPHMPQRETSSATGAPIPMPGFWDPRRRPERPDLGRMSLIRFLTENDYPPFNYAGPDGSPAGFNVDLARMICEE